MQRMKLHVWLGGGALVLAAACGAPSEEPASFRPADDSRLYVYTVNYPLQYFAERIGGEHVNAVYPGPSDADPALWSPSVEVIGEYQNADLIVLNGAGYAAWLDRVALPSSRMVDTSAAFADQFIELEETVTHSHGSEGEHSHSGWAKLTWIDPQLAQLQAQALAEALIAARPEQAATFQSGLDGLVADLRELDDEIGSATAGLVDVNLVFSHPVYQYLIRRAGLKGATVHWDPDQDIGHFRWSELDRGIDDLEGPLPIGMIWEAQPLQSTVERLAERGIRSVVFDARAAGAPGGDYLGAMRENIAALASLATP
jgi:zinc transport system substrate-binding protein